MPTVADHLKNFHVRLQDLEDRVAAFEALQARGSDPLQQEIDLDLPHASAGKAVLGSAAGGEGTVETEVTDDSLTVRLPATTPEQQAERRRFADEMLKLNEVFPDLEADGGNSAVECYAKGGPMWLYLGSKEGRDHIISLPVAWKQAMVEDITATMNAQTAHEFGRDVLKDVEPASGMDVTYDYLLSTVE